MELERALEIANKLVGKLEPVMERVSIAGSVRRKKPEVKDIEIVATPGIAGYDLFGRPVMYDVDAAYLGRPVKAGPKYKQIVLEEGINLDLFIVTPPAQFGVIMAIRTGPAEFSKALVTARRFGGYLPSWARVKDGAVIGKGKVIPMPEEKDFFEFCGLPFINPEYRGEYKSGQWLSTMNNLSL